jgi:hypothetical protein
MWFFVKNSNQAHLTGVGQASWLGRGATKRPVCGGRSLSQDEFVAEHQSGITLTSSDEDGVNQTSSEIAHRAQMKKAHKAMPFVLAVLYFMHGLSS